MAACSPAYLHYSADCQHFIPDCRLFLPSLPPYLIRLFGRPAVSCLQRFSFDPSVQVPPCSTSICNSNSSSAPPAPSPSAPTVRSPANSPCSSKASAKASAPPPPLASSASV